ncbi:MAG: hypothetical protein ABEJ24_01165 [Candidatus Magasanikbacteria bacterium]
MSLQLLSLIIETLGTLMIAFAALRVHHRVMHEHDIDSDVLTAMKLEQLVGVIGASLVLASFGIEIYLIV